MNRKLWLAMLSLVLLGLLAGLDSPSSGDVRLNGIAISYLPEDKLSRFATLSIAY